MFRAISGLLFAFLMIFHVEVNAKTTGIWYSTLYSNELTYNWIEGHGSGSTKQFLSDVDNDGDEDAVVYFSNGKWYVSKSSRDGFGRYSLWRSGHGVGSTNQFMADVNGDGRGDAIVFFSNSGRWYVSTAKPSGGFNGYKLWISNHGISSQSQLFGDVNGDGRSDAISYSNGQWRVSLSTGSLFASPALWRTGHGVGSKKQLVGDVNGDGRDDAVVFFNSGRWYTALSKGNAFGSYSEWTKEGSSPGYRFGGGSVEQLLGDVNNDGMQDAIVYHGDGRWHVVASNGTDFQQSKVRLNWKSSHGHTKQSVPYPEATWFSVGDIYGNGYVAPVVFRNSGGIWQALPGDYHELHPNSVNYYNKPRLANGWEGINYGYTPVDGIYDSGDPVVIEEHLQEIEDAGIDFILLDQTNRIFTEKKYIIRRAVSFCDAVVSSSTKVKFAVAIGGIQFSSNPQELENEARHVYELFFKNGGSYENVARCNSGSKYQYVDGKPLLTVYANQTQRRAWENSSISKTNSNRFTIRWVQGSVCNRNSGGCSYPVVSGKLDEYYGWAFIDGAIHNDDVMVLMPGWDNHGRSTTPPVLRNNGAFYELNGWQRVVCDGYNPDLVMVASYNEYGEDTAVAPSYTSDLPLNKRWSSPSQYWNITKLYNAAYKSNTAAPCS
jgi:hypothetical protein